MIDPNEATVEFYRRRLIDAKRALLGEPRLVRNPDGSLSLTERGVREWRRPQ